MVKKGAREHHPNLDHIPDGCVTAKAAPRKEVNDTNSVNEVNEMELRLINNELSLEEQIEYCQKRLQNFREKLAGLSQDNEFLVAREIKKFIKQEEEELEKLQKK